MSVSDNSTLSVARDGEGTYQSMDGHSYGVGDLAISSYEQSYVIHLNLDLVLSQLTYIFLQALRRL